MRIADVPLDLADELVVALGLNDLAAFELMIFDMASSLLSAPTIVTATHNRRLNCPNLGGTLATRIQLCGRLVATIDGKRVERKLAGMQARLLSPISSCIACGRALTTS